jgi:hypothetical protein
MTRLISFWPIFVLNAVALIGLWFWTERYGEHHWLATILAYIPQHLYGLPTILLSIWAIRNQNPLGAIANLIVMTGFLLTFMGFNIPKSNTTSSIPTLRFVTYNLHQDDPHQPGSTVATLKRLQPDIAVLQESRDVNGLLQRFRAAFPNYSIEHHIEVSDSIRAETRSAPNSTITSRCDIRCQWKKCSSCQPALPVCRFSWTVHEQAEPFSFFPLRSDTLAARA